MNNYRYKVVRIYIGSEDAEAYFSNDLDTAIINFKSATASQSYLLDQSTDAILLLKEYSILVWVDDDVKELYRNDC